MIFKHFLVKVQITLEKLEPGPRHCLLFGAPCAFLTSLTIVSILGDTLEVSK